MFEKLDTLKEELTQTKNDIKDEERNLCKQKLKDMDLNIGDMITDGKNRGFLVSVRMGYNNSFKLEANAVKKDGTPSKNSAGMWCDLDKLTKAK